MKRGLRPRVSDHVIEPMQVIVPATSLVPLHQVLADDVTGAIEAAYEIHAERLRAFAIAATRDRDVADEMVQESFLRLVVQLRGGERPNNVAGWLYRVCGNLIVSRGRRRSVADRMRQLLLGGGDEPSPEAQAITNERDRLLALALSRLPPNARVALLLAARGMGASEIGVAIHRSPAASRTYLFRARVRLRDELKALGMGER